MTSRSNANYATHSILQPSECDCDPDRYCPICDGGLSFCTVCKGGEIELETQSCQERLIETQGRESQANGKEEDPDKT